MTATQDPEIVGRRDRFFATTTALRWWAIASLVANATLIVTGGVVRLTKSGLGCPTWPQCQGSDYVPHAALGVHGIIEFGNRTLTFVLAAVAIGTFVAAWQARRVDGSPDRSLRALAFAAGLAIPAQAVIGGITVLTQLNPWIVSLHLLASVVLVAVSAVLVVRAYGVRPTTVSITGRRLVLAMSVLGAIAIVLGTAVTGAGPHSGDGGALRNGLAVIDAAKAHAWVVWALVAVTIAAYVVTRKPIVGLVLVVELIQGAVGYVQYFTGLPVGVVAAHLVGIAMFTAVASFAVLLTKAGPA